MTTDEAAAVLLLDRSYLTSLAKSGAIKAKKDGRCWVFDADDVHRWKAARAKRPKQNTPWRNGMVLGRQNWRCSVCSQLNTRRNDCSKCGTLKKGKSDVNVR